MPDDKFDHMLFDPMPVIRETLEKAGLPHDLMDRDMRSTAEIAAEIDTWYIEEKDGVKSPVGYNFDALRKFSNCGAEYEHLQYALLGAGSEIDRLRDALEAAEIADRQKIECTECAPEAAPETCVYCCPSADNARVKRWAALNINQPDEAEGAPDVAA